MTKHKRIKEHFGILLVLALAYAGVARAADPPDAHGALWVPFAPGCEVSVAEDLPGVSMAFAWTGANYEQVDTLMPGYGYFLIPENADADLPLPDCRLDALGAQTTNITLHAGWNLLGNPMGNIMTFDAVADASGVRAQAFAARAAARSARAVISQGGEAQPGGVVWVYALQQGAFSLADLGNAAVPGKTIKSLQVIWPRANDDASNAVIIPGTASFSLSVSYEDGETEIIDPVRAQWTVSDDTLGRFDKPGVLTSVAPGTVSVTAALGNATSASVDVQFVAGCEKICISAIVAQDEYADVAAYEQFAETLRTQHLGIMPAPKSDCAYMEVLGKPDIKPVKQAALSLFENFAGDVQNVRAYCKQNFGSGGAAHVITEANPLGGADRTVWLKDITAQAEWSWDNKDVINGVSQEGIIHAGTLGYANLTASFEGRAAAPAFVGVDKDRPESILAYQNREAAGYSAWLPEPWIMLPCQKLSQGLCRDTENSSTRLGVLPLGLSAPVFASVAYASGREDADSQGVTWSAAPEGIVSISQDGMLTAENPGRVSVYANIGDLKSNALDVVVEREQVVTLDIVALIDTGASQPRRIQTVLKNNTLFVHDPEKLTFDATANTSFSRAVKVKPDEAVWTITDAAGAVSHAMDFSGTGPFAVTMSYKEASVSFKVVQESGNPVIKVFATGDSGGHSTDSSQQPANTASRVQLNPSGGIYRVVQAEFSMSFHSRYGYEVDCTADTQWSVTGPDGQTVQGEPRLDTVGVYTVTGECEGQSRSVTVKRVMSNPRIHVFSPMRTGAGASQPVEIMPRFGIVHVAQPELLTFTATNSIDSVTSGAVSSSGMFNLDVTADTQWSVTGPDGQTVQGEPRLDAVGVYTVTGVYQGQSHSVTIERVMSNPKLHVHMQMNKNSGASDSIELEPRAGIIRVSQPELLTFTMVDFITDVYPEAVNSDITANTQWSVTGPDGQTVQGEPRLDTVGVYTVTGVYQGQSRSVTIERVMMDPKLRVYTQRTLKYGTTIPVELVPIAGIIHVSQPELLTLTMTDFIRDAHPEAMDFDITADTQWSVTGPDGQTRQGEPRLDAIGAYKVSGVVQGISREITIEVYEQHEQYVIGLGNTQDVSNLGDVDNKFKSAEPVLVTGFECMLQDWQTRGRNQVPYYQTSQALLASSKCRLMNAPEMDALFDFETSDSDILTYEGGGILRAKRAGMGWVRAWVNGKNTNALEIEVWEDADNFPMCAQTANQDVWHDRNVFTSNREARSRAILQADCDTYERGEPVKVRWFGQVSKNLTHGIVNVRVDLDIMTCDGLQVKRLRCDKCKRAAARAATDFSDYTTVFDTVEEWDQTDDTGNAVGPGCYMAHAVFNIIADPVLEVQFMIQ